MNHQTASAPRKVEGVAAGAQRLRSSTSSGSPTPEARHHRLPGAYRIKRRGAPSWWCLADPRRRSARTRAPPSGRDALLLRRRGRPRLPLAAPARAARRPPPRSRSRRPTTRRTPARPTSWRARAAARRSCTGQAPLVQDPDLLLGDPHRVLTASTATAPAYSNRYGPDRAAGHGRDVHGHPDERWSRTPTTSTSVDTKPRRIDPCWAR